MANRRRVTRTVLLKLIRDSDRPLTVKEISKAVGLSQRYVLMHLRELVDRGDLIKVNDLTDMRSMLYIPA